MPPFLTAWNKETTVKVTKKQTYYMINFRLPAALKEEVAYSEINYLECDILMGFYTEPLRGDILKYQGLEWEITGRKHFPNKRYSREPKVITEILVKVIGKAND